MVLQYCPSSIFCQDSSIPQGSLENYLQVANKGKIRVVAKGNNLLVDHKSEDSEHGSTAVVELDGTLLELGLLIKVIPAEVNVSVTEVTNVLVSGSLNITHEANLQPSAWSPHQSHPS